MLKSHLKFAHPIPGCSNNNRKPEKFPRPDLKLDSSAEEWSEVLVTWQQYEEEYNLAEASLIRQLFACCSEDLRSSLLRTIGGSQFDETETQVVQLLINYLNMQLST